MNRMRTSIAYRYGFNGKENDGESGTQDYGMRIYNPALGKFLSVDPLFKEYSYKTPYDFAENDVIRAIDLDGGEKKVMLYVYENTSDTKPKLIVTDWSSLYPNQKQGPLGDGTVEFNYYKSFKGMSGTKYYTTFEMALKKMLNYFDETKNQRGGIVFYAPEFGGGEEGTGLRKGYEKRPDHVNIDLFIAYALGGGGSEPATVGGSKAAESASAGTSATSETSAATEEKKDFKDTVIDPVVSNFYDLNGKLKSTNVTYVKKLPDKLGVLNTVAPATEKEYKEYKDYKAKQLNNNSNAQKTNDSGN